MCKNDDMNLALLYISCELWVRIDLSKRNCRPCYNMCSSAKVSFEIQINANWPINMAQYNNIYLCILSPAIISVITDSISRSYQVLLLALVCDWREYFFCARNPQGEHKRKLIWENVIWPKVLNRLVRRVTPPSAEAERVFARSLLCVIIKKEQRGFSFMH